MSAFVVNKTHIDLIVDVAQNGPRAGANRGWRGENRFLDPNALGRMLWLENVKSVEYRYEEERLEDRAEAEAYTFTQPDYRLTLGEALSAISCLDYQSCEHPGWEKSDAKAALDKLQYALVDQIKDKEVWEWSAEEVEKRVAMAQAQAASIKARVMEQLRAAQ